MNPIYANLPTTIFEVMSGLARELGAINLGQGFPDEDGPPAMLERAVVPGLAALGYKGAAGEREDMVVF